MKNDLKKFIGKKYCCTKEIEVYRSKIKKGDIIKVIDWHIFDKGADRKYRGKFAFIIKRKSERTFFKIPADMLIINFEVNK